MKEKAWNAAYYDDKLGNPYKRFKFKKMPKKTIAGFEISNPYCVNCDTRKHEETRPNCDKCDGYTFFTQDD